MHHLMLITLAVTNGATSLEARKDRPLQAH